MSFSVGICGLPNVGKSTLFKVLTKREVEISERPFTTIEPNIGVVSVPDERLEMIAEIINFEKITPTSIRFVDVAGLVKNASKGEGLGNQFLNHLKGCDAILKVIRCFESPNVENVLGEINPMKEIEILETELIMKDLETVKRNIEKLEKIRGKKWEILKKLEEQLSMGKPNISELEREEIQEYQFLSLKPSIYLLNINGRTKFQKPPFKTIEVNLKEEEEMLQLTREEKEELGLVSKIDELISESYSVLNLITFFTIAKGKELRAWTLRRGSSISEAARKIHSDFERFVRAEVVNWKTFVKAKSWQKAREEGLLKIVSKNYIVEDGDIIEFKI